MKSMHILEAMTHIDSAYITAAQQRLGYLSEPPKKATISFRRKLICLAAAILLLMTTFVTAMAVSEDFRDLIFSIFNIETHEQPPASHTDIVPTSTDDSLLPTQPGLHEIDVINIDGAVNAFYFSSNGYVMTAEGGFYTCEWGDPEAAPTNPAFWEITADGIIEVKSTRVDFPFTQGEKTFRIIFDYAVLGGKLSIRVWPEKLSEDPTGNGWNIEAIGNRTDIVLMTVPVYTDTDYTQDYFLLDLTTLEAADLLDSIQHDSMVIYGCRVTNDLRYAILSGIDKETGSYDYWFCDLERNIITTIDALTGTDATEPYFLNDNTIVFQESLGDKMFNIVRHHIPTGVQNAIIENTTRRSGDNAGYRGIQYSGGNGTHCLLFREDGSVDLIDLRTRMTLNMTGLDTDKLATSESPDGKYIMIAYEEANERNEVGFGFSRLGILNPETGVLKMLTRDISGNPEAFWGWLNNDALVITAHDTSGGYYVYVYQFRE